MRKIHIALLTGLVVVLAVTTGCQQRTQQQEDVLPYTEPTPPATTGTPNATNIANTYVVDLAPMNNSGVDGSATVTVNGNSITVEVNATGLEPNRKHPMHIHGFRDQTPARMPETSANVTDQQAEEAIGPPLLVLSPFPEADGNGTIQFTQTFDDVQMIYPLHIRAISIHGMSVNNEYDFTLPVAAGLLEPSRGRAQQQQQGPRTGTQPGVRGSAPTAGPNPNQPGMRQGTTTSPGGTDTSP